VSASPTSRSGGIDLPTLITTAVASAVAAYVTSRIWAPGTLAAAAFTPVLVAVLKEALIKPAEVVTRAVPVRGVVRSAPSAGDPAGGPDTPEAIEARIAQLGEAPGISHPGRRRRAWQVAIVTGLLGFILAAVIITVPELVSGNALFGGGRDTTLFSQKRSSGAPTNTTTNTTPTTTDDTQTVPPAQSVTVPPPAETITVPPPAESTTVPEDQQATPPPAEQPAPEVPATPPSPPAP
jgi:hypothetical protein